MDDTQPREAAPPGLRERKKARAKAAIRACALRLFRDKGYAATTVEEIAEAAEVSPSTFFRYFGTKEDVAFDDGRDPLIFAALLALPAHLPPIPAFRSALRQVLAEGRETEGVAEREWLELIVREPALRGAFLGQMTQAARTTEEALARRLGRDARDPAVRTLVGAVLGVMLSLVWHLDDIPGGDVLRAVDESLALLEAGLPLA